jgi:hypothetical protein
MEKTWPGFMLGNNALGEGLYHKFVRIS